MSQVVRPLPLRVRAGALSIDHRVLWSGLDLDVATGELVAVLGPNGSGKTSLFRAILGLQRLDAGEIQVAGAPIRRGNPAIGYLPQQGTFTRDTPLRGRELVGFGVSGTRFGMPLPSRSEHRQVTALLERVGADRYGDRLVGTLSGGEQQRLRIAQALAGDPALLLLDEPFGSLDLQHQSGLADLLAAERARSTAGILVVTHDINPLLGVVDRVLYLAGGSFRIGTPEEVLRSDVLSELYGTAVDVIRSRGHLVVVGAPDAVDGHHDHAPYGSPGGER